MDALLDGSPSTRRERRRAHRARARGVATLAVGGIATRAVLDAHRAAVRGGSRAARRRVGPGPPRGGRGGVRAQRCAVSLPPHGPGSRRQLDAYAQEWIAAHQDACAATAIRGEQSGELLDLRMALSTRRPGRAAGDQRRARGRGCGGRRAHRWVARRSLPPLARCNDPERLRVEATPAPADAERGRARARRAGRGIGGGRRRSLHAGPRRSRVPRPSWRRSTIRRF